MVSYLSLILFIGVFISGCAGPRSYVGNTIPKEKLALLRTQDLNAMKKYRAVWIYKVDDVEVGSSVRGYPRKVRVVPGRRVVKVRYVTSRGSTETSGYSGYLGGIIGGMVASAHPEHYITDFRYLDFTAGVGREYELKFSENAQTSEEAKVWIVDRETGAVAGNEVNLDFQFETTPEVAASPPLSVQ